MRLFALIITVMLFVLAPQVGSAQHPIDVQRKTAEGQHFDALIAYEKLPKRRRTTASTLAAARSSWALGLNKQAKEHFEQTLATEELTSYERAQSELARGVIEYQEGNYQVAILQAEKVIEGLNPGTLRSRGWFLWAESLAALTSYGPAEEKYRQALDEAAEREKAEIYFRLGTTSYHLGRYKEAKQSFERVPIDHERTPETIRALAKIAMKLDHIDHVAFWLKKGKDDYPDHFLDSWVDYAEVTVAKQNGDREEVRRIRKAAEQKYPPSDPWLTLLQAAAESFEWTAKEKEQES